MNKYSTYTALAIAGLALLLAPARVLAGPINVTIPDNAPANNGFIGDGSTTLPGSDIEGLGQAKEDNETERVVGHSTVAGQAWDTEAFFVDVAANKLFIVGGYDFLNGLTNGRPGDLFIKVGGEKPTGDPTTYSGSVTNSLYDYTYAIDLSVSNYSGAPAIYTPAASFGLTANVYTLTSSSVLLTTSVDPLGSNPWKFDNSQQTATPGATAISYTTTAGNMVLGENFAGSWHNVLEIDLTFMGDVLGTTPVWFSYTMECGNDSLKGYVPDGGMTALLIAMGFAGLALARGRRRA